MKTFLLLCTATVKCILSCLSGGAEPAFRPVAIVLQFSCISCTRNVLRFTKTLDITLMRSFCSSDLKRARTCVIVCNFKLECTTINQSLIGLSNAKCGPRCYNLVSKCTHPPMVGLLLASAANSGILRTAQDDTDWW